VEVAPSVLQIRASEVLEVKIAEGVVSEGTTDYSIKPKVFKHNGARYCCIEQDDKDGRFTEVTPKFYLKIRPMKSSQNNMLFSIPRLKLKPLRLILPAKIHMTSLLVLELILASSLNATPLELFENRKTHI